MAPDIDQELRVVLKALEQVISPALDPADPSAAEQLRLCIAALRHVQGHFALALHSARRELANAIDLAETVNAAAPTSGLDEAVRAAGEQLHDIRADQAALDVARQILLAAISEAVNGISEPSARRAVDRAVIAGSRSQLDLARAWFIEAGREPDPQAIPPLDSML